MKRQKNLEPKDIYAYITESRQRGDVNIEWKEQRAIRALRCFVRSVFQDHKKITRDFPFGEVFMGIKHEKKNDAIT